MAEKSRRKDGLIEKKVTINGKRISFYGHNDKEINKKIREYKEKEEDGKKFQEVADDWWEEHYKTLSPNSLRNYKPAYERATGEFGAFFIKDISKEDIQSFIDKFSVNKAFETVSRQHIIIGLIFKYAEKHGYVGVNPVEKTQIPKGLPQTKRELPTEEELKIVENSINCTGGLFAYFLYYTGCRRGEALAMQYKDIDRKNKIIHVSKSLCSYQSNLIIKTPKTKSSIRNIILLDNLAEVLPKGKPEDYIFTNNEGGLITDSQFANMWKAYREQTGVTLSPHQLRHGYATLLFEVGVSPLEASRLMGHSSKEMTELYTHISHSRFNQTAEQMNSYISKLKKQSLS